MASYSQNQEDLFVLNYFGDYKGTLLEIGANDGVTLSNSKLLIESGWRAHLVEPGQKAMQKLKGIYDKNKNVYLYGLAIGETNDDVILYESGCHVPGGADRGLVSTISREEIKRWPLVQFDECEVEMMAWDSFYYTYLESKKLDFISIDAEGLDWHILKQIDLEAVGCRCLCIEWNRDNELGEKFSNYCKGYKVGLMNAENLIFIK